MAHFDNAISHRSAATEPVFNFANSDMLSSHLTARISVPDSFLFGHLKRKLQGEEFDTMEELQTRFDELVAQLTPETMQRAYEHWIARLQQVRYTDGHSV
jgi:hypothetical protein